MLDGLMAELAWDDALEITEERDAAPALAAELKELICEEAEELREDKEDAADWEIDDAIEDDTDDAALELGNIRRELRDDDV